MRSTTNTGMATRGGLGPIERILRIAGGGLVTILGVNLALASGGLAMWAWFAALLGLGFVVAGVRGYCPLYARLGIGRLRAARGA